MMDHEEFLATFFGSGNGLDWDALPEEWAQWLEPWTERVRLRRFPILLPRWTGGLMVWYAVAGAPSERPELVELITAFVGHSYAEFPGRLAPLNSDDPIDIAVREHLGDSVYQFTVPRSEDMRAVRAALDRLRNLLDSRPTDTRQLSRPTGRVLRDFELALVAGEDSRSLLLIEELRGNGHLNTANIAFLEIVRLADLGDWDGVLHHPQIARLVEMRRPVRVTAALVEAVYRRFFIDADDANDVGAATTMMRETVLPRYGALYQGTPAKGRFALSSLLLTQLASDRSGSIGLGQLLALSEAEGGGFTSLLAATLRSERAPQGEAIQEPVALARGAIAEGQPRVAIDLLASAGKSVERTVLLLQCAYELNTLADANLALAALESLDASELERLPQTRQFRDLLIAVQSLAGSPGESIQSPAGWAEWFNRVASDAGSRSHALKWAQLGADEWDPTEFEDEDVVTGITEQLGLGSDDVIAIHRDALPYLLRAASPLSSAGMQRLQRKVLDTLLYTGNHSRAELDVLLDVLENTIADMATKQYQQVLADLTSVWSTVQSPAMLEWAVEALDVLMYQPSRDQASRQIFAAAIFATANVHQRRLDMSLRLTLDEIGREIGVASGLLIEGEVGVPASDPLEALLGQRVAIYTLTEGAGLRARDQLQAWTKTGVELLTDKVCSEALRVAARESDIFVMVTRSAKHAATDCIRENRPAELPLLKTSGKGTSSLIYAVRSYLAEIGELAA